MQHSNQFVLYRKVQERGVSVLLFYPQISRVPSGASETRNLNEAVVLDKTAAFKLATSLVGTQTWSVGELASDAKRGVFVEE